MFALVWESSGESRINARTVEDLRLAWFPVDSFEVEADRWITTAEHRRRNGPSAKLMYQPVDCTWWFGPSRLSFSVLFSALPRAPSNRPGLQNPRPMWTPPGLSGPTRIPPTG